MDTVLDYNDEYADEIVESRREEFVDRSMDEARAEAEALKVNIQLSIDRAGVRGRRYRMCG